MQLSNMSSTLIDIQSFKQILSSKIMHINIEKQDAYYITSQIYP